LDNLAENAIRPLALGRKNYLFCGNHDAALRAAIIYSLIGSCKAVGVDPRPWLEDVLVRISECEKNQDALRELLPNRWQKVSLNDA
jgi:transposase